MTRYLLYYGILFVIFLQYKDKGLSLVTMSIVTCDNLNNENESPSTSSSDGITITNNSSVVQVGNNNNNNNKVNNLHLPPLLPAGVNNNHTKDYSWIGNQWYPPAGIPMYTPQQIREVWSRHNVLMVGDSTERQDWATISGILHSAAGSSGSSNSHILALEEIQRDININKKKVTHYCTKRDFNQVGTLYHSHEEFTNASLVCRGGGGGGIGTEGNDGKFDSYNMKCIHQIQSLNKWEFSTTSTMNTADTDIADAIAAAAAAAAAAANSTTSTTTTTTPGGGGGGRRGRGRTSRTATQRRRRRRLLENNVDDNQNNIHQLSKQYDIIIIEMGIWEILRPKICGSKTLYKRLEAALETAQRVSSPGLQVYWKTVGAPGDENDTRIQIATHDLNNFVRDWFVRKRPLYLHLHDWGKQIQPRALGSSRISGDLPAHWGPEARTLNVQMLTHDLYQLDHHHANDDAN